MGAGGASDGLNNWDLCRREEPGAVPGIGGLLAVLAGLCAHRLGSCRWPFRCGGGGLGVGGLDLGVWQQHHSLAGSGWRGAIGPAGCARGALWSREAPARQTRSEAVAPPMPPTGSATAGTGRCTPLPNPHPGFRGAGHRIRSGRSPPESVQTNRRAPTPRQTNTSNHRKEDEQHPVNTSTLNPDRVNLCIGGRRILKVGQRGGQVGRRCRDGASSCCARVFARAFASL
jgi:hypothetical protein